MLPFFSTYIKIPNQKGIEKPEKEEIEKLKWEIATEGIKRLKILIEKVEHLQKIKFASEIIRERLKTLDIEIVKHRKWGSSGNNNRYDRWKNRTRNNNRSKNRTTRETKARKTKIWKSYIN